VLGNAFGPDDERYVRQAQMPDGSFRKGAAERRSLQQYRGLRRRRDVQLWGDGVALHGARFPDAFGLWRTEGSTLDDWPLSYQDFGAVLYQGGVGDRSIRKSGCKSVRKRAAEALSDAAFAVESRSYSARRPLRRESGGMPFRFRWRSIPFPIRDALLASPARTAWDLLAK